MDRGALEPWLLALGVLATTGFAVACTPIHLAQGWRVALGAGSLLTYALVLAVAGLAALRRGRYA